MGGVGEDGSIVPDIVLEHTKWSVGPQNGGSLRNSLVVDESCCGTRASARARTHIQYWKHWFDNIPKDLHPNTHTYTRKYREVDSIFARIIDRFKSEYRVQRSRISTNSSWQLCRPRIVCKQQIK